MAFPWSSLIPAVGGAIGSLFGGNKPKQVSTKDKNQQEMMKWYMKMMRGEGGPMADLGSPFDYEQATDAFNKNYRAPAYQQFQENAVPTITGQFRSKGLMDSTYAGEALGRAGRDVQTNLDAKMSEYLQRGNEANLNRRQQMFQNMYGQDNFAYNNAPNPWQQAFESASQFAGQYYGGGGNKPAINPAIGSQYPGSRQ